MSHKQLVTLFFLLLFCTFSIAQNPNPKDILSDTRKVNDYFMTKYSDYKAESFVGRRRPSNIWTRGVYYEGLMALYSVDPHESYFRYAMDWARFHRFSFRNGVSTRNADDYCAAQTYIDLSRYMPDSVDLQPVKELLALHLYSSKRNDWSWIDAIQMGMPVFAKLGASTLARQMYLSTRDSIGGGLFNEEEGLWWRDADFVPPYKEPNGNNCYWSRGNGWVYAAIPRTVDELSLPEDAEFRQLLISDFISMSKALVKCQRSDGYWNVSLHCEENFGGKETSGTSLFVYGMAWGIRHGILDPDIYLPVVNRAWNAMVGECIAPDGFLRYVQGTGKEPKDGQPVTAISMPDFEDYGIGCFLLAGSEMYKLYSWCVLNPDIKENNGYLTFHNIPDGNYRVDISLEESSLSDFAVRAESRRHFYGNLHSNVSQQIRGQKTIQNISFLVNKRDTLILGGPAQVRIKPRERSKLNWDNNLTLEFVGDIPSVKSVNINRVNVPTLYLCGNSTVVDQDDEPWASWGQMLPYLLDANVAVANYGESGESSNTFIAVGRLAKIGSLIKPGDYLFVEFGHNDEKQTGPDKGPYKHFTKALHEYARVAREHGATLVVCTPTQRRFFAADGTLKETHGEFPDAVRKFAAEEGVALIDLTAMTTRLYEAMGPENSKRAFVHYPANTFQGQNTALADNTHFNPYGAYEIARCIVQGISDNNLPLADHIKSDVPQFNPSVPDSVDNFHWLNSKSMDLIKPDGN